MKGVGIPLKKNGKHLEGFSTSFFKMVDVKLSRKLLDCLGLGGKF